MFKKPIVVLLITLLLCGSTSQSTWAAEMSPAPETSVLTEVFGAENTAVPPGTDAKVEDGMPHGLILATQNYRRALSSTITQGTVLQIYVVDPVTGSQTLWSQFGTTNPNVSMGYTYTRNAETQFNNNYTKFATNLLKAEINEFGNYLEHAGWLDQNGNFFDVSAALDHHNGWAIGFYGPEDSFYFGTIESRKGPNNKIYTRILACKATEEEILRGEYHIIGTDDDCKTDESYYNNYIDKDIVGFTEVTGRWGELEGQTITSHTLTVTSEAEPSKKIFIVDYLPMPGYPRVLPIQNYESLLCDSTTGALIHYLPDSYKTDNKSEWGGVLSPDGTTVAYLTVPGTKGNIGMEFVDISQFIASGLNPAARGVPVKKEFADGPIKNSQWHVFNYVCDEPSCVFLEWRP